MYRREVVKEWLPHNRNQTGSHAQTPISKLISTQCMECLQHSQTLRLQWEHLVNIAQTLAAHIGTRLYMSFTTWSAQRPTACSLMGNSLDDFSSLILGYTDSAGLGTLTHAVNKCYVFLMCGTAVSWSNKLQTSPALLSTKSWVYGLHLCAAQEAIWLANYLSTWIWNKLPRQAS